MADCRLLQRGNDHEWPQRLVFSDQTEFVRRRRIAAIEPMQGASRDILIPVDRPMKLHDSYVRIETPVPVGNGLTQRGVKTIAVPMPMLFATELDDPVIIRCE